MEIVQERLEREYDLNLILTTPNVGYKIIKRDGSVMELENPSDLPNGSDIARIEEPILAVSIFTPVTYMDAVMESLQKRKRGLYQKSEFIRPHENPF